MALIQWSSGLSVQVNELDEQHKKLIALINSLQEAMRAGKGKDLVGKILNELVQYTVIHFSNEEKYFARFDYSETAPHMDEHKKFVQEVSAFKKEFDEGQIGLSIKLMSFLSDWLKNHIMGSDKKYGPFFNEKGLH